MGLENIPNYIYRFRSIEALFKKYNELEKQSIYFSELHELNDPLEGMIHLYLDRDIILWDNLLRVYVVNFILRIYGIFLKVRYEEPKRIFVLREVADGDGRWDEDFKACFESIIQSSEYSTLLEKLTEKGRVDLPELAEILATTQSIWMDRVALQVRLLFAIAINLKDPAVPVKARKKRVKYPNESIKEVRKQWKLIRNRINRLRKSVYTAITDPALSSNDAINFPSTFAQNLRYLLHSEQYVACFSNIFKSIPMWSYYTNDHKGCCLVFSYDVVKDSKSISLRIPDKLFEDERVYDIQMDLEVVDYVSKVEEVEFFSNVWGESVEDIRSNWYTSADGEISEMFNEQLTALKFVDSKNSPYHFGRKPIRKLNQWSHEGEIRAVLPKIHNLVEKKANRTFSYDIKSLHGVIFGLKTSVSDQRRVISCILSKLDATTKTNVKFFQARFDRMKDELEAHELDSEYISGLLGRS